MIDWVAALAIAICPQPYVGDLSVRPASDDGERIALRASAGTFEHRFPRPGTYGVTVTVDASTEGCRRLQTSPPATLRVTVPVRTTSRPSSL